VLVLPLRTLSPKPKFNIFLQLRQVFFNKSDDFATLNPHAEIRPIPLIAPQVNTECLQSPLFDPILNPVMRPTEDLFHFAYSIPLLGLDVLHHHHFRFPFRATLLMIDDALMTSCLKAEATR
jgi:hypothetical protein